MNERALHVLVIDDSAVVRQTTRAILESVPGWRVTTAADPVFALERLRRERPDVILLDLVMPRMDGMTFLRRIMREDPIPTIICSSQVGRNTEAALRALDEGAVEIIGKPSLGTREFLHESATLLVDAVRAAADARIPLPSSARPAPQPGLPVRAAPPAGGWMIAIGASTGGTEALHRILEAMPVDAPAIVVVQHMPEHFTRAFADRLDRSCRIEVKEAEHGDRLRAGRALIAPGNRHLSVLRDGPHLAVEISDGPLVSRHRPSVDVLFRSVAQSVGGGAVGVILTGMGDDGADGLLRLRRSGARTLAQDEASCVVFGMPREAIARGAVERVVPLAEVAPTMLALAGAGP